MARWIQSREPPYEMIPAGDFVRPVNSSAAVHGDVEAFVSPIDQSVIDDRGKLRRHNAKHGVTDSRDYSHEFMLERSTKRTNEAQGKTPQAQRERRELIREAIERSS